MKNRTKRKNIFAVFILPAVFLMNSCFGVSADIALNQNGSGTIALEYRISKSLDSLGRLDGNERWNTIPVGRADFERTLERLPEMKLLSFTSAEDGKDLVITAKMEFSSIEGLLAFMDAGGRRSAFSGDGRSGRLVLTLAEGNKGAGPGLNKLLAGITESYFIKMGMTFPGEGGLVVTDSHGKPAAIPGSEVQAGGKRASCSFPLFQVITAPEGINLEFSW
jgi:hypothetical protein